MRNVSSTPLFSKLAIDEDIAYCRKLKIAPSIVLVCDSGFGIVSWTPNKEKSVASGTRQPGEVFGLHGQDVIKARKCSSRVLPIVPSEATSYCLKKEWQATSVLEHRGILPIQWTAMLAGLIEELTYPFPDSKPIVAFRCDGWPACLPLLALLFLLAPSFYLDCSMKSGTLDQAHKQMGTTAFNASMRALDHSTDARRFRQASQQSDIWFRFRSRILASAIPTYHGNPEAPEV